MPGAALQYGGGLLAHDLGTELSTCCHAHRVHGKRGCKLFFYNKKYLQPAALSPSEVISGVAPRDSYSYCKMIDALIRKKNTL